MSGGGHGGGEALKDPAGKRAGLQAAILAVLLAITTIFAHRAHTDVIRLKNEEANLWNHYQAKKIRSTVDSVIANLLDVVPIKDPPTPLPTPPVKNAETDAKDSGGKDASVKKPHVPYTAAALQEKLRKESERYEEELKKIKLEAEQKGKAAETSHHQANFFDLAEALLEIGLVMTSLYFISHSAIFPVMGLVSGLAGVIITVLGLLSK